MNRLNKLINRFLKRRRQSSKKARSISNTIGTSSSDMSVSTSTNQSPDIVLNAATTNSSYTQITTTEITLEHSTLEQMYTDNSVFSSQILDQNIKLSNSMDSSVTDSFTSFTISSNSTVPSKSYFENSTVQVLHEQIRLRLSALRYIATRQLNLPMPVNISMLESIYDMKLTALNDESAKRLLKFDKSCHSKFFNTLSVTIKGLRHRSKSIDKSHKSSIKGVCIAERDALERQCETKIRAMQLEILSSINSLEIQYGQLQRDNLLESSELVVPRARYKTENALKKRIRNRHRHRSCSRSSVTKCGGSDYNGDSKRSSLCLDFESSMIVPEKYKNECAEETMV